MIKKIEFINKHTYIKYTVQNNSTNELNIPFIPDNEKNYESYITTDTNKRFPIPIEVVIGNCDFSSEDRDKYRDLCEHTDEYYDEDTFKLNVNEIYSSFKDLDFSLKIFDLTDREINGYETLDVTSKPIWLFNGKRKFQYKLDGMEDNLFKKLISAIFKIESVKSVEEEKIAYHVPIENIKDNIFFIDTDEIGKLINISDSDGVSTESYIDFKLKDLIISCPIDIKIIDLSLNDDIHKKEEVSIDFGTSSTCIAYSVNKMLHFSDRVKEGSEEEYENMTSFFIYNWEKMNPLWNSSEKSLPHLLKLDNDKNEELNPNTNKHFGDGRNVQILMRDLKKEKLGATVFGIKNLATLKKNIKFRQYYQHMVSPDLELGFDEKAVLDPIEFYAYLIGRKLNSPIKGNIYSKYHLTTPVKYSLEAIERIRNSFELGLKRSLPNNIKSQIKVSTTYDEPTALLGNLFSDEFSSLEGPKFFSIFDFGGGTLDYIFGVVRPSVEEGKIYLEEKEEEEYEYVVEIFNSGGSNECGGEKILRRMAYLIYLQNAKELGKTVPILVPDGEEKSDLINSSLYGNDVMNRVNLEVLVEKFARKILYGISWDKKEKKWISNFTIENESSNDNVFLEDDEIIIEENNANRQTIKQSVSLRKQDSTEKLFTLEINIEDIINLYLNIIEDNIKGFKKDLEEVLKLDRVKKIINEYKIKHNDCGLFEIFLAGNSCKSPVVENKLIRSLEFSNINYIKSSTHKYNLKTAVAKGYKKLNSDILIYNWKKDTLDNIDPLKYRILNFTLGQAIDIIPKNSKFNSEFKRFSGLEIDKSSFTIYYTENSKVMSEDDIGKEVISKSVDIPKDIMEKYVNGKGKMHIYIQAFGYDKIIYAFGKKKEMSPEILPNLDEFKNKCVITL